MDFKAILDKVIPTLIVALIFAIYSAYNKIGYLEYTAEHSIIRYAEDRKKYDVQLDKLEIVVKDLNNRLIMQEASEKCKHK